MATLDAGVRNEIAGLGAGLRTEMATLRVELLKWAFLFWAGQVLSVATIVGLMG